MKQTEQEKEREGFCFTYSAAEQQEVKAIRDKYQPKEENKLEKLRRLDESVSRKAMMYALSAGVAGTLILGMGMSLVMTEWGSTFGLSPVFCMIGGIGIGLIGLVLVILAYPLYQNTLQRERKRIAPEVLRLTEELMK